MRTLIGQVILRGGNSQLGTSAEIIENKSLPPALTDAKGNFALTPIPPGGYDLLIDNPNYASQTVKGER